MSITSRLVILSAVLASYIKPEVIGTVYMYCPQHFVFKHLHFMLYLKRQRSIEYN